MLFRSVGPSWPVNFLVFGFALTLGYAVLLDGGFTNGSATGTALTQVPQRHSPATSRQEIQKNSQPNRPVKSPNDQSERESDSDEEQIAVKPDRWQPTRR